MSDCLHDTGQGADGTAPLDDGQLIELMAWADGELEGDAEALARVEALLEHSAQARGFVHDLRVSARAMRRDILDEAESVEPMQDAALDEALDGVRERVLAETEAMAVMAWADGELKGDAAAEVASLVARSERARALASDVKIAAQALRVAVMDAEVTADLSTLRGRVMTRLPQPARAPQPDTRPGFGEALIGWLRGALLGRGALAIGLAAAAVLLAVALSQVRDRVATRVQPGAGDGPVVAQRTEAALPLDGEPAVIIEEMEIDAGTVLVDRGEESGAPTIIWHILDDEEGAG